MIDRIHSIEPLQQYLIDRISKETKADVVLLDRNTFPNNLSENELSNIKVLICRDRDKVSNIIDVCANLKFIFIVSTGVEKLPFNKLIQRNIRVANTGGVNADIMSEYVIGYILSQSVRICENLINQTKHYWKKYQCVDSLSGKNLLIVGAGRTGQLIAEKAKVFKMNIIGVKKHITSIPNFDKIISLNDIEEYLHWADYIVCTLPLTPDTEFLFDENKFSKMSEECCFINISRGKLIKQNDLINILKEGKIKSAILDVYEVEPVSSNSDLWDTPNLYMSPHSSGRLENFLDHAIDYFIKNMNAYNNNNKMPNELDLENGY